MRGFILLAAACAAAAQTSQPVPVFGSNNILPHGRPGSKLLAPGMVVELWGQHLAPAPWCGQDRIPKPPLPRELCGVRVLIASRPAELMYVGDNQINLKIPADVFPEGMADFQVCVHDVCSAPVSMRFSAQTALLQLEGPAYVHMPVWMDVDAPAPYIVPYPCGLWPWSFDGYEFEVRRNGQPLTPIPPPPESAGKAVGNPDVCDHFTNPGRLPLHLLYRFDQPGTYSVRLTAKKNGAVLYQSEWTNIRIEPFSQQKRDEWLRSLEAKINQGSKNLDDVVPSLLAWPDERALALILKIIPAETSRCRDYDCVRLALGRATLAAFDDALLHRVIPVERLRQLCPPNGACK